jgi:opacity protein-like surface antigen
MQKTRIVLAALLCLAPVCAAQSRAIPKAVNFRYSAQLSNSPPGTCGCFALQGFAADSYWKFANVSDSHGLGVGLAADVGVEHTRSVGSADYGMTLTTLGAGPRLTLPGHRLQSFTQVLIGLAHGSNSVFPVGNSVVSSASSIAFDVGGGADYAVTERVTLRPLQVDYLRIALPNTNSNWQSNLRIGAGITLHFPTARPGK